MKVRAVMAGLALVVGLTAWLPGGLATAQAAPTSDPIALAWDAPAAGLVWYAGQSASAMGSFVGSPVVVPGDQDQRTLHVRNDGPSAATALVQIVNVSASGDGATNQGLASLLHLTWRTGGTGADMTWRQAIDAGDPTWSVQFDVAQGAEFAVTAGYYFPVSATGGQADGNPSYALHFDVRITLTGHPNDVKPSPKPDPTPDPQPDPPASAGPGASAATGGSLLHGAWTGWAPTLLGAALISAALVWRRRNQSNIG